MKIEIDNNVAGERLDVFLANRLPQYSRSLIVKLIKNKAIKVNKLSSKPSYPIQNNDVVEITDENVISQKFPPQPQKLRLNIIFEDNDVIVIDKAPGMVVHPAAGNSENTLVNALLEHYPDIKNAVVDPTNPISTNRPGLVHRLDKDTSGLIVVAKNPRAMHSISRQIQKRTVKKIYLGLCYGILKDKESTLTNYLGRHPKNRKMMAEVGESKGKIAVLEYKVRDEYFQKSRGIASLVEFNLKTGRTHQIRVQTKTIGHPIVGDSVYNVKESMNFSSKIGAPRQLLHAHKLTLTLPGKDKPIHFVSPLPKDFNIVLRKIDQLSENS